MNKFKSYDKRVKNFYKKKYKEWKEIGWCERVCERMAEFETKEYIKRNKKENVK